MFTFRGVHVFKRVLANANTHMYVGDYLLWLLNGFFPTCMYLCAFNSPNCADQRNRGNSNLDQVLTPLASPRSLRFHLFFGRWQARVIFWIRAAQHRAENTTTTATSMILCVMQIVLHVCVVVWSLKEYSGPFSDITCAPEYSESNARIYLRVFIDVHFRMSYSLADQFCGHIYRISFFCVRAMHVFIMG